MKEIRNPENRLIFCFDEKTGVIEILEKSWITQVKLLPTGKIKINHQKKQLIPHSV